MGERDLMIAATALANGHEVLTLNRSEFERVPGLMLREYPSS
ncbi:type II toxin-antitoxin system VapC family toxin [Candidatus Amarobacter glycogenicus]